MDIIIGADIVPTQSNIDAFTAGEMGILIENGLETIIQKADYRIFNLEIPLTDRVTPIQKCGEALSAPIQCVNGLKAMGIDLLTLSNNHIMDQGEQGLKSTLETLNMFKIAHVGADHTLRDASKPYFFICDRNKIGVYACCEHEFSIAEEDKPGANPFDYLESFDHVKKIKAESDYVIVLYHGGKEHYRYPSPNLQRICHKFVDCGADLIVCQHSHCIGAKEIYKSGTIVYGQGNFLFDGSDSDFWRTSLLINIRDNFHVEYIPIEKYNKGVRLAKGENGDKILSEFEARSREIEEPDKVRKLYDYFAENYLNDFLSVASGKRYSTWFRIINKILGNDFLRKKYINRKYSINRRLTLLNRIECESNNELFSKGLKISIERMKE